MERIIVRSLKIRVAPELSSEFGTSIYLRYQLSNLKDIRYPAGSYKPSASPVGGTGFYATPIDLSTAKTVSLEYKLFFPADFQFNKGGKLPGLIGGHPSCSGGNKASDCFSTRFMVSLTLPVTFPSHTESPS